MSKDNLSSLYNGLIKKGYSSDDIGDEATFRSKMADKENRKALYDYVSSRGDFRIGDYESYESRLSGKPQQEKPDINVPAATAEQGNIRSMMSKSMQKFKDDFEKSGIVAQQDATKTPVPAEANIEEIKPFDYEEFGLDLTFKPKPVSSVSDIFENYSSRFSLTERGKQLSSELAKTTGEIQERYANEFIASPEFKALQQKYKGQELDDMANEAFRSMYSAKIDSELRPYVKAFQDEAFARYETDLSRDLSAYQEKEKQKTKESIASDVSSLSASVNNLLDDNHRRLSSHAGSGGSAMSAIMGSRKYIQETEQDRKSKSQLEAAQKLLEESQNIIDEAGRKGKTSFIAGLGRGFADTAFDADNWLFGLPDIRDSKVLMDTLDKYDKGEALTESEQALMDAAVANMATNAYYYSDLGRGYKAGSVTGQSIPFMLEFAINPVSGSGSAIAKSILKYGMKKFGKSAVKNSAAKFAARLAGDAAAAAAMTGTSSLARVAAGAIERAGGDIQLDETGTGYAGRTGQMGAGEALGKSFASTFLENQSEMVFNAFSGLGSKIWKSAEKYIPGGTAAIMDNAIMGKAGEIYRKIKSDPTFKEVARRTQFHGIGEEYLEEVYNNFANIPLGEMTLEEATDLDNNIDTFLGLAPTSVAFGVIGLGGLTAQKMQHRKKMKAAFGNMSRIERERLAKLEELGEKAGNEDIKNFIRETILDKDLSPEEKKAEIEYAYNLAVGNAIDDVEAAQQDEIQQSSLNASQEGAAIYAEHNPETMRQTVLRRELAEQKLIDAGFAAEDIERMKSTPVGERGQLLSSMDEASSQPVTDFFNAFDREEAMNEALDTAHEEEVSQARSMLQDIVLPNQTVTVIPLGQYGNEQAQYGVVVSGIDANGNPTQNNGAVVTYPVQVVNGVPDFSTIDKGNAVVAIPASYTDAMVFSPDDAFNGMLSAYQQDAAILEGTPISQGAQFPVMFDDGSMQNIIVAGTAPTGESVIVLPDGKTVNMPVEELSMRKRNAELAPLMAEQAEEEQVQQQAVQEAVTAGYSEEVKNLQPQVDERLVVNGENVIISEISPDGLIVNHLSESGDIIGSKMIPLEAYYDYKQTLFEQQNELTQQQTTGENVSSQPGETGAPDSTVSTTEGEAAEVTGIQQEAGYPMDENGEPDFLRMQPQQTVQLLADTFAEDAASFVSDRLSAAQKAAEKAAKKSPKALGFNERVKELSEIKQERENAAREIEYWQNISSLIGTEVQPQQATQPQQVAQAPTIMEEAEDESRRNQERLASMTEEEIAAAQAKVQENIDKGKYESRSAGRKRIRYSEQDSEMGEAFTPMEHVLREIATGRIVFQWGDKGSTQGLGSHLGMSDSNKERQSLIWALSNEGYTPEAAAEIIHGDMPAAMQELVTDQDVFNMILDAFSQYGSPSRMFEAAQQMHGNDLESQKGYEEDMERQQLEWEAYYNNMSVEEWSTLVDIIEEELEYQLRTFTDEDINAIFEEIYNEQYGTGRIETESTEGAQQSADSEGSNEIQPQQESDNETADGRSEVRPEETAASDEQGGSTLSQPGFTVEKRYHKKDNKDIFAVNFTERMERAAFLDAKKKAKDAGGYYSSFGKGGFIFETEEAARNFAESILPSPKQPSIEAARAEVEQNPTEAQKEAGNYKKGHITIDGYNITLENPKGSERSGTDKDGNKWSVTMNNDYGYIRGTKGVDGDHIDVFLSDTPESGRVFVVDQVNEDGSFDEHKVMYGFDTLEDAREAYLANYSPGWTGLGQITEVTKDQFKKWIGSSHRKTKPFAEYKSMITPKKPEEVNGYRKGDKVYYGGKPATIYDFEYDGRPVLDTGLAPVLYTIADWKDVTLDVSPITANFGKTLVNKSGETEIRIGKYDGDKQTVGVKINGEAQSMSVREVIGLLGSDEWSEVKEDKPAEKKPSGMQRVSVEGLFEDLKAKGTAKLSDNVVLSPIEQIKSNLDKEISKREKELDDIKSGKMPNTMYGNGSRRADLLRGEIREYKGKKQDIETLESLKPGVAYLGEGGKIITILSEKDGNYSYSVEIDGHSLELKATAEQMGNVVGMDDLRPDKLAPAKKEETAASQAPAYGSQNKVVSTARYEELRRKMREKLNNLNAGYDPELVAIGAEMAAYHVEAGARKFVDFAKRMLGDMGEEIRPYLKLFYNSVRDFPGMESYEAEMTPYEEVRNTDINNIKLTEDEQAETNTEAVVSEAEAIAGEAETVAATGTAEEIDKKIKDIDASLEKVNSQLALLGYYEADTSTPFHEVYGYAKSSEKKALADAKSFAKKLQKDLGVKEEKFSDKRRKLASANIAPAGGSITVNIPLQQDRVLAIYIPIDIDRGTDDMFIPGGIMYRIESGPDFAGSSSMYINEKSDYPTMLNAFRRLAKAYLPKQEDKPVKVPVRNKSSKRSETLSVGDLFTNENDVSLQGETIKQTDNEQERRSETENKGLGKEAQQEDGKPVGDGMDRSSTGSVGSDKVGSGRSAVVSPVDGSGSTAGKRNERNNRNERAVDYAPKSPKARFDANIRAIKLMRELVASDAVATRQQMEVLRKFSGWGGLGTFFNNEDSAEYKKLRELLSDEEFDAAANSINSAYYTPSTVIDTLWDIAGKLGFKGGNILEGSAGIGNIIGSMPVSISENSSIEAVEIDPITGNILKLLYPDAKVNIQGFEDTRIRNGSVDLAITNVPFVTGLQVHDPIDKDLSRKFRNIHDFCIAKNVRKLREGSIGIFITSSGTMDKSTALREWLVNEGNADFIGAFRLNNKTFEGASVTSDIIVVRKRVGKSVSPAAIDAVNSGIVRTGEYPTGEKVWDKKSRSWVEETKTATMELNNYFQQHPENMAGDMAFNYEKGETRYPGSYGLFPAKGKNQNTMLAEWVDTFQPLMEKGFQAQPATEEISTEEKNGALFADEKGNFYVSEMGVGVPLNLNANKVRGYEKTECLKDYNTLKSALDAVLQYQVASQDDAGLKPLIDKLNEAYDTFVSKYGSLNKNTSISFLRNDVDFPSVAAIEEYKEYTDLEDKKVVEINKTNVFKGRVIGFQAEPEPKTVKDGVIASIYKFGHIDLDYISDKLKRTPEDVKQTILSEGIGFVNPESGAVEVRYNYLSGNVRQKLQQAKENNENGEYTENIKALEQVMPLDIPAHLINFSLGSSWIDPALYADYIKDRFGVNSVSINHVEGIWNMKTTGYANEKNRSEGVYSEKFGEVIYGTELVEAALNNRTIQVKKVITHSDKTKETVVDKEATQACLNRIQEIKDDFKEWMHNKMLQDEELATNVAKVYNEKFNNLVPMVIDEMFLPAHFGGSSEAINLYTHQKRAVIRGTTEPLLLAHEVGSGKTFTLISTAMEMRRLGTAKKPMIVVQNATVGQFVADAKKLYPNAKVLTITERDRTPEGRRAFYGRIKYSDWDLIIVPQSTFDMIPDSPERQLTFIQEKIDEKQHAIEVMQEIEGDEIQIRQLENELTDLQVEYMQVSEKANEDKQPKKRDRKREEKTKQNIAARVKEQLDRKVDEVQYFDEMGIDAILVDEAHEYKRLGFSTAMTRGVKGIDPAGSKKAAGVYLKTRAVLEQNGWKNVIFATGTPISNTAAEIWTFMRYLMPKSVLKENEIYYFDDFVRNFGSITQSLEFATSGKFKENTRFAAYINKPELIRLWSSVSDTVLTKDINYVNDKIPRLEKDTHQDIFLPQSDSLISIMNAVRAELERFENMTGKEKRENSHIPLTMYGIAKRAAIDTRLVDANAPDDPLSKTNKAVEETLRSLDETKEYKGTVAIFCDNQRRWDGNKVGFDLFEDIREKLIARGVPANQIIIMKPGMSVNKKQKIFDEVNAGSVRVVIGNTQTLGTGVNIQERLHTLIHMDAPDRPMDYTQRNGRILRQGNMHKVWNKPVRILRFGVEDSLDVTSYQRLKTKAAFIDSIMDGKAALANNQENRTLEEEEEGLFDNPVAILSGSQYALLKNQAEREYRKFLSKKSMYEADQIYVTNKLAKNKQQIETTKGHIEDNRQKLSKARELFPDGNVSTVTIEGSRCSNQQQIDEALKELVNKKVRALEDVARKDAYFRSQTLAFKLKFDGVDAVARVTLTRQEDYDFKLKATRITVRRGVTYDIPAMGIKDYTAPGGYVKSAIDDITQNIATGKAFSDAIDILTTSVTSMEAENELLSERKGKPFEFGKELEAAKEKVDEYTELMKAELAEKEAKYAGRGAESDINLSEIETEEEEAEAAPEDDTRFRVDESEAEAMTYIIDSIHAEAAKLNIAVKVYTSLDQVPQGAARRAIERGLRVKGWHYKGDICVYLPYADGMDDIKATILHEGVAHFGLRKMIGEKNMNAFMDGIYAAASPELRKEIVKLLPRYNYDMHIAVEEYIATLVESGVIEPTFWEKVKQLFRTMLENLGFTVELTDNDLRYILWESRNNLLKSGNPADVAKDTMMRKKLGIGMFGTRSPEETLFRTDKRAPLVEEYDAAIDNNSYRFQEAFQDSMLSLKVLQDLIEKQSGKPIRTFENAYTAENRLSSVNKVDNERYLEDFFKPLLSQIDKLAKMSDRNSVENYIYAKSGLERNEVFLLREADKVLKEKTEELDKRLADKLISQKQYDKELQELKDAREKFIAEGKDYSGLTGLVLKEYEDELNSIEDDALRAKRQKEIEKEYKNHAEKIVSDFEGAIPSAEVDKLWQLIKAANDENLRKQFDSGMISTERYEELRNMMQYYVPLRGWQESIAEDFYDYTRKESPVQKEKAAKGRKSLADNPIANIALSAQNAIILGNRNKMKQRFFNFIINRPNELVTIRDQWYARTLQTVHEQMEPVYPDIKETDDSATIQQKLEDFENEMRQLEEAGLARRKKIPLGVELKMKSGQKPEHMVSVMINGQEYVMYINGNPRAAQALNGKTNPEGEENIFWEYYNKAKRLYGGGLTSNNPDFVAANFVRDSIHSATMQFLNNGLKSASLFVLNTPRAANAVFRGVMGKYKPGNVTDQYFQEFIQYGGETGYTAIHTIEDYKREYEKALNEAKGIKAVAGAGKKSIEAAVKALEVANRIAEDVNRFNAYMSSREAGKTIEESIDAAKNITVNFNKKGSLGKGKGAWAALAWFMNKWILFFNPAVQGLYQVGQTTKKNRKRVAGTLATIAASGFIMPYFNALLVSAFGGDDKDDYFYQTDYTRMNNWLIFTGDGYVKIPLPPFFREIYGMGDILHRMLTNRITPERAAVATMRQLQSAIGFINLIPEGEPSVKEAVSGIMPDIIAPLMDVALNRDFTGRDIAKDTEWTKNLPEYERVYRGVSPVYVEFSRMLNQIGGDDARRSPLFGTFINPAYMEHIITSYTGGIGKTISNLAGAAADIATGEADNIEFRTIPVINRFGSPVTERSIAASVNRVFYDYLDRYEAMKVAEKRYKAFIKEGRTDFRKELEQMKKNGESELIRYFDAKMKVLRKKQNLLKENPDNKDLEKQIIELKSEMVLKAKKILE